MEIEVQSIFDLKFHINKVDSKYHMNKVENRLNLIFAQFFHLTLSISSTFSLHSHLGIYNQDFIVIRFCFKTYEIANKIKG